MPMKQLFMQIYQSSIVFQTALNPIAPLEIPMTHLGSKLPFNPITIAIANDMMQSAYDFTSAGKYVILDFVYLLMYRFTESIKTLKSLLLMLPFMGSHDASKTRPLITLSREYITGQRMETTRRELTPDKDMKRMVELGVIQYLFIRIIRFINFKTYFTHSKMRDDHIMLSLNAAMRSMFNIKNYGLASQLASRLAALGPETGLADKVNHKSSLFYLKPFNHSICVGEQHYSEM